MNPRQELEELKKQQQAILDATTEDSFKVIASYVREIEKNLQTYFTSGYLVADDKKKMAIDNQSNFVRLFREILLEAPTTMLEQIKIEEEMLTQSENEEEVE